MSNENTNNITEKSLEFRSRMISFYVKSVIGAILLIVVTWTVDIVDKELPFSFSSLMYIHDASKIFYLIDLFPFVLMLSLYLLSKRTDIQRKTFIKSLEQVNIQLTKNEEFAKRIGEGDFSVEMELLENDTLGASLLLMRDNLVRTSTNENELNWVTKGKERITDTLRFHRNIDKLAYEILIKLGKYINAVQGIFYIYEEETQTLKSIASYAYNKNKSIQKEYKIG